MAIVVPTKRATPTYDLAHDLIQIAVNVIDIVREFGEDLTVTLPVKER